GRRFVGYEINPDYVQLACGRVAAAAQAMPALEPDTTPTLAAANDDVSPAPRPHLIP
ncbi:MAG: site-specific DNA-methyltransferase, partial [Cupriavidus sp.]|nr:site-specific DNA-methyltransferase [Cupriavidus sp.]